MKWTKARRRKYMHEYYLSHLKPQLESQKSKAMKKLEPYIVGACISFNKKKMEATIDISGPRGTPQLPPLKPEENPCCPHCGTLRVWKLECPQCFRDPNNKHKPPSPRPSPNLIEPNNYEAPEAL